MLFFFFSSRRRHTRCALVTGVQTCALPISYRRFKRLVVNRERPFGHPLAGKEPGYAFRIHDEGPHAARRIFVELVVGYVGTLPGLAVPAYRSEEPTSELQSLMRISYAVLCLNTTTPTTNNKTRLQPIK